MAPRKRKVTAADAPAPQQLPHGDPKQAAEMRERLALLDAQVEERAAAIRAAADAAVAQLRQQLALDLVAVPARVRGMPYDAYVASLGGEDTSSSAAAAAAAAAVERRLRSLQHESEAAAATAAPATRSLRSRSRAATGAAAAAQPQTVRATRARQPVPKFSTAPAAEEREQQPAAEGSPLAAPASPGAGAQAAAGAAGSSAAVPAPAAGADANASDTTRAAAVDRAKARVDALLAGLGREAGAAGTAARGGRTVLREAAPGEAVYSKNGSPLHANVTRARGRAGAALVTPALAAAGVPAPGCVTLFKRPAATGRAGRSRAAMAAAAAGGGAGDAATGMTITTDDGSSFSVEAGLGLTGVPERYRAEVEAKLRTLQALAAAALGGGGGGGGGGA